MKHIFLTSSLILITSFIPLVCPSLNAQEHGPSAMIMMEKLHGNMFAKRDAVIANGLKKLSVQERSAIISLFSDANMYNVSRDISAKDKARIEESLREIQSRFGPAKWMGPNGETYDSYSEYLESVWGVPYPSPTNPYDPFR